MWSGYWVFASMLCSLQVLHVFWFYLIARMIYRMMIVGEIEKDVRSDDEGGEDAPEEDREGDKKEN
jgi:ceramide synthetase